MLTAGLWQGVTIIPDEVTRAKQGEIVITAVMLAAVEGPPGRGILQSRSQGGVECRCNYSPVPAAIRSGKMPTWQDELEDDDVVISVGKIFKAITGSDGIPSEKPRGVAPGAQALRAAAIRVAREKELSRLDPDKSNGSRAHLGSAWSRSRARSWSRF